MPGRAVFQVCLPGQPGAEDVLGLWHSPLTSAGVAFDMTPAEAGSLWRAELPDDLDTVDRLLLAQRRQLAALAQALPAAQAYLRADLANLDPGGISYALGQAGPQAPLSVLSGALQFRYPEQADSFGPLDIFKPTRQVVLDAADLFERFTHQVRQAVGGFAQVDTIIGGRRLGRSRVAWSGDLETWWTAGGLPGDRRQHEQVLANALATRQHWLRFFLLVAGGIPRVAGALAAGPFSPVAIWATWNYFRKVITAYQQAAQAPSLPANHA